MSALLEVQDLVKRFPLGGTRKTVQAVNGVEFTIDRGETHAARVVIVEGVDERSPLTLHQIYKRGIKHVQGHITGERGAPDLRRLSPEVREDIAARVRGDDGNRPAGIARPEHVQPLRKGA